MSGSNRFAVDIGGTFTDLIVWEEGSSELRLRKTSTTAEPGDGVLEVLAKEAVDPAQAGLFVHGTTLCLNALLQGRGAALRGPPGAKAPGSPDYR